MFSVALVQLQRVGKVWIMRHLPWHFSCLVFAFHMGLHCLSRCTMFEPILTRTKTQRTSLMFFWLHWLFSVNAWRIVYPACAHAAEAKKKKKWTTPALFNSHQSSWHYACGMWNSTAFAAPAFPQWMDHSGEIFCKSWCIALQAFFCTMPF